MRKPAYSLPRYLHEPAGAPAQKIRPTNPTTMKRTVRIAGVLVALAAPAVQAQVINFHDANQGYSHYGGYNVLYYGQGAYSDPNNNVWNGFGMYGAPGSTDFYGPGNPDSNHGSVPAGNPGQPYAWYTAGTPGISASGPNLFSPSNYGAANTGNATSAGNISPVTISLTYGFDNGANGGITQGQPSWILSHAAVVNGGSPGIGTSANPLGSFTLANVPAGTYDLFLYGANFDGTRGASFSVSSGTFLGGISTTINPNAAPTGSALNAVILGQTYVEAINVTPDSNGDITGTWGAVSNPNSGLSGEGDFNGLQLVPVPEPSTFALFGLGLAGLLAWRRRK
jgi:PEP-CTERM motif